MQDAGAVRGEQEAAAAWVLGFASAYGPWGGHRLVDGTNLVTSAASAIREARVAHPAGRPYAALAEAVQRHAGDQATLAVLLMARLVRLGLRAAAQGLPLRALLDGYALAARQAAAVMAAEARPAAPEAILRDCVPALPGAAATVVAGLRAGLAAGRRLEDVDLRVEPRGEAAWLRGVIVEPSAAPEGRGAADAKVLLLRAGPRLRPRTGTEMRLARPGAWQAALAAEEGRRQEFLDGVQALGARLLVVGGALEESLSERLAASGVLVVPDAPRDLLRRLEAATGASAAPDLPRARREDLGRADLRRRPPRRGGWSVQGAGPSLTLALPAWTPAWRGAVHDDGERLLRAAGLVLADPQALPGGGRWQRQVAASLRRAADAAPGKSPLGLQAAAEAFDALADELVRNAGGDPLDHDVPEGSAAVLDPYPCARLAVAAAFEAAAGVLRVDARWARAASSTSRLRGGPGRPGSPKGMPGDIPPLM